MKTAEEITRKVMRRVWGIYIVRKVMSPAVRTGVAISSVLILFGQVSLPSVIQNAYSVADVAGLMKFALVAFIDTSTVVQVAIVAVSLVLIYSMSDFMGRVSWSRASVSPL